MEATSIKFKTVDEYISALPAGTKKILRQVRKTIKEAAPEAEERISYGIPAFKFHGMLIWFAGWKDHISIYPKTAAIQKAFKKELDYYKGGKGTIQFPTGQPVPLDLISKIVKVRIQENLEREKTKKKTV